MRNMLEACRFPSGLARLQTGVRQRGTMQRLARTESTNEKAVLSIASVIQL